MRKNTGNTAATMLACLFAVAAPAIAGDCGQSSGPDLLGASLGGLSGIAYWGNVNGINAYSFSTNVCNVGTAPLPVQALNANHPVFTMNMYRLEDGRFEQIGQSWAKHMFGADDASYCCPCQDPNDIAVLGVGCSDAYGAGQNGGQEGFDGMTGLGPRSDVNPVTGSFPFPYTTQGQAGDAIYKRLQVSNEALDPALHPGALYFAEEHYVGPADAAAGNQHNNTAYRPIEVAGAADGGFELVLVDTPSRSGVPAVAAWAEFQPSVNLVDIDVAADGRFVLGFDCTDNGDGTWHYEYAIHNLFSHRSGQAFTVPIPAGVAVTNIDFHDVDAHSGEPYDPTDWSGVLTENGLAWSSPQTFGENENANALRWGTLYNFRFDANAPPQSVTATLGLFRPGTPGAVTATVCGPSAASPGGPDINGDGSVDVQDLVLVITGWGRCPDPPASCPADIDLSGEVDVTDLLTVITNWT